MKFNIKKIIQRRQFADYLIETTHPELGYVCKVVSVRGVSEKDAIKHLEERFDIEGTVEEIKRGFHPTGKFPGNNDYWGWANTLDAWFTKNDIIARRQKVLV